MSRHKARETAFKMLFQLVEGANDWQMAEYTLAEAGLTKDYTEFAAQLAKGAWQQLFETEQYICQLARGWQYDRLFSVDRLLLHMAMYELKYLTGNPPPIVIDEAIELAREYGTDDSPAFVNAVLDNFLHLVLLDEQSAYRLSEQQLQQVAERQRQAEAAQTAAAAEIAKIAEQAWADKSRQDYLAASHRAFVKGAHRRAEPKKLPDTPEAKPAFRKIRRADLTPADLIKPEPED